MKKALLLILAFAIVFAGIPAFADIETLNITIDGELVDIPEDYGAVMIYNNRTMVPVRFISEFLRFSVNWDNPTRQVSFMNYRYAIVFQIGSDRLLTDFGTRLVQMDAPAMLYNDRSYIPIRFFAEAISMEVEWDNDTRTVHLTR